MLIFLSDFRQIDTSYIIVCQNDVTLYRSNAMINVHVKTQDWVKHQVWHSGHTDPWPNPTRPKSLTRWPRWPLTRFHFWREGWSEHSRLFIKSQAPWKGNDKMSFKWIVTTTIFLVHQGLYCMEKLTRTRMFSSCRPRIYTLVYSAANTSGYLRTFKTKFYNCYLTLFYDSCYPKPILMSVTHGRWMKQSTAIDMCALLIYNSSGGAWNVYWVLQTAVPGCYNVACRHKGHSPATVTLPGRPSALWWCSQVM